MMYVDGYPDQASVLPTSDTGLMQLASGDSLYLGPAAGSGRQFNGYLKDVRIYNYALTRAQVQALLPSLATPMAGHWTFDAAAPWAESSGYKPAGTHDLLPVGTVGFSADAPPGRTGQSLDLTAGGSAVVVSNSNQQMGGAGGGTPWTANPTWQNTFDVGLFFWGRDLGGGVGSFTPCLLNDVRVYRTALSQAEVLALVPASPAPKLASRNAGVSGLHLAWPIANYGYKLQQSGSLSGPWSDAGLIVAVEGNERAAYAPVAASAQFFRLVKQHGRRRPPQASSSATHCASKWLNAFAETGGGLQARSRPGRAACEERP
jgi:hypothetical protein